MNILQCSRGSCLHFEHTADLRQCSQTPPQSMAKLNPSLFQQTVQFDMEYDCLLQPNRVYYITKFTVYCQPTKFNASSKYQKLATAVFPSHREELFLLNSICEIVKPRIWIEIIRSHRAACLTNTGTYYQL
jgi:hypothetical protein